MEATLNNHFRDLKGDVGFYLGYGRGADNDDTAWDAYQAKTVERVLKGGLRKFYNCGYEWTFLRPVTSVTLLEGENTVALPDDFGSAQGRVSISASEQFCLSIPFGPIGTVYQLESQFPANTGRIQCLCEEPLKGTSLNASNRRQIHVYPLADQDYTLKFQYNLNPSYLTGAFPYAYGGPQHAETLLQACKATAEIDLDNIAQGPQFLEFSRLLQVSMAIDGRNKQHHLGYNRDLSDMRDRFSDFRQFETVTFDGVTPA